MEEIIAICIQFVFSVLAFIVSIRSFREKGFLWNNAYICASRKERHTMDKKPYYRQSAVVFLLIGIIFLLNGIMVLCDHAWIAYSVMALCIITSVYAVASSIIIKREQA